MTWQATLKPYKHQINDLGRVDIVISADFVRGITCLCLPGPLQLAHRHAHLHHQLELVIPSLLLVAHPLDVLSVTDALEKVPKKPNLAFAIVCRPRLGCDRLRVPQIAPLQIELGHRDLAGVQSLDAHRTERILIHVHRAENAEVGQGAEDAAPSRGQYGQPQDAEPVKVGGHSGLGLTEGEQRTD